MATILSKIFGNRNERTLRRLQKTVIRINELAAEFKKFSDAELQAKTAEFRDRLAKGETLDNLLPEAFATVREASDRVLGLRHFDVQLIGGMVLYEGKIAEMRTGEGKTLVATLPAYLKALKGEGVHIITVNDYLAKRDAEWMNPIFQFLGLTTGVILNGQQPYEKQNAYRADITYGTNNEFGFDYLRDNMAFNLQDKVQRGLSYAIVDEVDSILIDEARTPLIISGAAEGNSDLYVQINKLIPQLIRQIDPNGPGDYSLDEKARQAYLTESGHQHVEELMQNAGLLKPNESLYGTSNIILMHHLMAALRAHTLFQKDVDYIVQNQQVVIVDEHTGRIMIGRRWSDGLHQAVEAKENVPIQNENQTLASITFQNYFRLYDKLAGMTGTADTEAYEFQQIYGLEVVVIPTNKPIHRNDVSDEIYLSSQEKFNAVIADIKNCIQKQQPVLVGTASIETSEYLSDLLKKENIPHQVLNAKFHEKEATIVAEAGRPGAVTIATNMAGRGTDIVLGGKLAAEISALGENPNPADVAKIKADWQKRHEQVVAAGGLHIIGSERHESRRIDNQLRGRSGRQGDPGSSRFYLALDDNLMRIFAPERLGRIMQSLGMKEGENISHPLVNRSIETAQRKVESRNFDIRKQLLEYDDVANDQRKVIYTQRNDLMSADNIADTIKAIREDVVREVINQFISPHSLEEQWDVAGLEQQLERDFGVKLPVRYWLDQDDHLHEESLRLRIHQEIDEAYDRKEAQVGATLLRQVEKSIMLQVLDNHWREHLAVMDHLRQGIHLRGFAAKNPKQEYKREAFQLFTQMLDSIKQTVTSILCTTQIRAAEDINSIEQQRKNVAPQSLQFNHPDTKTASAFAQPEDEISNEPPIPPFLSPELTPFKRQGDKVGRNDACPCGSGKKYKHCHGKLD